MRECVQGVVCLQEVCEEGRCVRSMGAVHCTV